MPPCAVGGLIGASFSSCAFFLGGDCGTVAVLVAFRPSGLRRRAEPVLEAAAELAPGAAALAALAESLLRAEAISRDGNRSPLDPATPLAGD